VTSGQDGDHGRAAADRAGSDGCTELAGQVEGIGLGPLLNFLRGLGRGGRLTISDEPFLGTLFLDAGYLSGAVLGREIGLVALEAIMLGLGKGRFTFSGRAGPIEHNLELAPAELRILLDDLAEERSRVITAIPSLGAVPAVVVQEAASDEVLVVPRSTLRLLLDLDGRRSVGELSYQRGLAATLRGLTQLVELGVIRLGLPTDAARGIEHASPHTPAERAAVVGVWRRVA